MAVIVMAVCSDAVDGRGVSGQSLLIRYIWRFFGLHKHMTAYDKCYYVCAHANNS